MIYIYIRLTHPSDCRITGLRIRQCMGSCGVNQHEPVTFQVSIFCPSAGISQAGICIVQWSIGFLPCHSQPKHMICCGVWQRAKDWCWASCNITHHIDSHQADTIFWLQNWGLRMRQCMGAIRSHGVTRHASSEPVTFQLITFWLYPSAGISWAGIYGLLHYKCINCCTKRIVCSHIQLKTAWVCATRSVNSCWASCKRAAQLGIFIKLNRASGCRIRSGHKDLKGWCEAFISAARLESELVNLEVRALLLTFVEG